MELTNKEVKVSGLLPAIAQRWSTRTFQNKPVEREKLNLILEAARWSASCYNEQPWRFIVGEKDGIGNWQGIFGGLVEFNQTWAKSAPVLIVILSASNWGRDGSPNVWAAYDCGQAASSLAIQAQYLGLHTHQMGGIIPENIVKNFEIPEGFTVHSVMAVGYLGKLEDVPEFIRDKESAERTRKPLSEFVFTSKWGTGLN